MPNRGPGLLAAPGLLWLSQVCFLPIPEFAFRNGIISSGLAAVACGDLAPQQRLGFDSSLSRVAFFQIRRVFPFTYPIRRRDDLGLAARLSNSLLRRDARGGPVCSVSEPDRLIADRQNEAKLRLPKDRAANAH